jgi:hypothetical protein
VKTDPKAIKLPDGSSLERSPEKDESSDIERDVDHFAAPLRFDAEGNLIGKKPDAPAA